MKFILLPLVFCLASQLTCAQKNVSKATFFPESAYRLYGFAQERAVSKRASLQATFRFMPLTQIAEAKYAAGSYKSESGNPFSETKVSALGTVTELRVYGKKKEALRGFYWGPFFNANLVKISTGLYTARFKLDYNNVYKVDILQFCEIRSVGLGLQIGVQGIIKKKIAVDWTILGIGISSVSLNGRIQTVNTEQDFDLRAYPLAITSSEFAFEKYFPLQKTVEAKQILISGKAPVPVLRMSLSIGIAY
jgi:hypothetical protein